MPENRFLGVREAASLIMSGRGVTVRPREISTLIYRGKVDRALFPIVSGRRAIPLSAIPVIEAALGVGRPVREASHA